MNNTITLSDAVKFSTERVSSKKVALADFVSVDNLLPNKLGLSLSTTNPNGTLVKFEKDDILIGNIRPYLKKIWYADRCGGSSPDVLVLKVKESFDPVFVYYSVFRDDFFHHVMKGKKGTKMPRGDKNQILDFLIPEFAEPYQKVIGEVLSCIDAKIRLNNKINLTLENLSKTVFEYWFIQFDFPDINGRPYKSSGGKMVYNKTLKQEIPEYWVEKILSQIANITMGQSPLGESYNENEEGMVFFQGSTDFGWRFPEIRQYTNSPTRFAKKGDILLSVRAPVGTFNVADHDCCIGRGLAALNSKHKADSFLLNLMSQFKQIFDRRNVDGTTFGSITKDDLHGLLLAYPTDDVLKLFEEKMGLVNAQILTNHKQNQELAALRDWLLPLLMNGQVCIGEAKTTFEEKEIAST